ncbi:MAG: cellulase family glycosylhydrolase [Ignavibacteriae bacterium]|nr:cellulase family glycosylhydrolase [Ignavibacteriota bacterium]
MRKIFLFVLIFLSLHNVYNGQTRFTKGANLTNWFQTQNIYEINFSKFTKDDFFYLKSIGCDIIRIPINFKAMVDENNNYKVDNYLLFLLDKVCDWAEELQINIIIDNHPFRKDITNENYDEILIPIWKELSKHFKNRTNLIHYEILNEPHGISNFKWNKILQNVLNEIRKIDTSHSIIIGAANFNSYKDLDSLLIFNDKNIIYTFHFYEPFLFTHQGASWINPSMEKVKNISFPYNENKMHIDNSYSKSWIQSLFKRYKIEGTEKYLYEMIDKIAEFKKKNNVKLFCGEFGVLNFNVDKNDRNYWHRIVSEYLTKNNIAWTVWDFNGDFGLFDKNQKINLELLESLNFKSVNYENQIQIGKNYKIFSDYCEKGVKPIKSANMKNITFSIEEKTEGKYSLKWKNAEKYSTITFDFSPNKNLQNFANENAVVKFSIKFSNPNTKIDLRFVDSKINSSDHAWRKNYSIESDNSNSWQKFEIPLNDFYETGCYENGKWYNPENKFDWNEIDKFEIVAEQESLMGKTILLDEIEISIPN